MSLTRFLGATSREALRRVREALGADAMIVSNREVEGGVEIVATNDDAAAAAALPPPPRRTTPEAGAAPDAEAMRPRAPAHAGAWVPASALDPAREAASKPASAPAATPAFPAPSSVSPSPMPMAAAARAYSDDADFLPQFRVPGMPPRMRAPEPERPPAINPLPTPVTHVRAAETAAPRQDPLPPRHDVSRLAQREPGGIADDALLPGNPPVAPAPGFLWQATPAAESALTPPGAASVKTSPQPSPSEQPPQLHPSALRSSSPVDADVVSSTTVQPQPRQSHPQPQPQTELHPSPAGDAGRAWQATEQPQPQAPLVTAAPPAEPPGLLRAIDALQDSLGERIDGLLWRQQAPESPVGLAVYRTLLGAGFSAALARALATRVPAGATREDALAWVQHELAKRLPVSTDESAMFAAGGVYALVGPTGVGKTTTTAKLAARWVMAHGANRVAMLTTDGFRVGAHEQLRIYGRILGVPVLAVNDSEQLQHALRELKDKHVVLIDTVGMSQRDRNLAEQAALLCAAGRPVHRLLLLNAASHGDTLDEVAHAYRQDEAGGLTGCILTKIDEARQLGAALDIAIRHRLPIHYVSDGQRVPENVAQPNAPALVGRALTSAATALFAPTEADLAAVWNQAGQAIVPAAQDAGRAARRQRQLHAALGGLDANGPAAAGQMLAGLAADRTTVLSRQVWRQFHDTGDTEVLADLMLADVREHATQSAGRWVLAWHGRARTAPVAGTQRTAPGSVLWSEQGAPLAAPVRHLLTANGVVATFDAEALPPASGAESATARAAWLDTSLDGVRLIHGFDGFTVAQAQAWQARDWAWLARCAAPQRVQWEDTRITVGALAKLLGYAPAGEVWVGDVACTCWVASAPVDVSVPGQPPIRARLVAMRSVDADGRLHAQAWALTNVMAEDADTIRVGRWLSQIEAARRAEPWVQTAIEACVRPDADLSALRRGLLAGAQLGLSAWHLSQGQGGAGTPLNLGLPQGTGPRARRQTLDQVVRVFGALDMHEDVSVAC